MGTRYSLNMPLLNWKMLIAISEILRFQREQRPLILLIAQST
jgi:hypothetical protein